MRNFFRWIAFAMGATLIALVIAFLVVWLSRLYQQLNSAAFALVVLVGYSMTLTLCAIRFASKLDNEAEIRASRRLAARRDPPA